MGRTLWAAVSGAGAALVSALCCAGPLIAVTLGVSGAGLASTFDPLRPYLLAATVVLLGYGFWTLHREEQAACEPGKPCAEPRVRRRMKLALWVATGFAVLFATYPRWQTLLL